MLITGELIDLIHLLSEIITTAYYLLQKWNSTKTSSISHQMNQKTEKQLGNQAAVELTVVQRMSKCGEKTGFFRPSLHRFEESTFIRSGIRCETTLDCFMKSFDGNFVPQIVEETNRYQIQNPIRPRDNMVSWVSVASNEMYKFFATTMLMGIIQKPRLKD